MFKKFVSIQVILTFLFLLALPVFAKGIDENAPIESECQPTLEEILDEFHNASFQIQTGNNSNTRTYDNTISSALGNIRCNTVQTLQNAGYDAYDVNPDTYEILETTLNTDFSAINLDPTSSYIIVVEGEDGDVAPASAVGGTAGPTFTHTSGGVTYTMRYLTVTANDNPEYGMSSYVNLLSSTSQTLIQNCLDAVIVAYIDAIAGVPLGTVASICGLSISDFAPAQRATLIMHGATNWTRKFTQVWDPNLEGWMFAACVEQVKTLSYISGDYYDATTNSYQQVPQDKVSKTKSSSHYLDYTWRKEKAVLGYLLYNTQYDLTGNVTYSYDGRIVITHRENFMI